MFQPRRQNGGRLYLREVIPLIYKTPKRGFLPPHFPGAIPFKRTALYAGLTCTHGTRSKTNKGHLNIKRPAFCLAAGATDQPSCARPSGTHVAAKLKHRQKGYSPLSWIISIQITKRTSPPVTTFRGLKRDRLHKNSKAKDVKV